MSIFAREKQILRTFLGKCQNVKQLLSRVKRRVVRHRSFRHLFAHRQAHEHIGWDAFHPQRGVILETETTVVRRIADQDTTLST